MPTNLPILILLTITLLTVNPQEIKITKINNSPGILPFKLGKAKIITSKHVFLYDINLSNLKFEINKLIKLYTQLNSSLTFETAPYVKNAQTSYDHLKQLIEEIDQKLENIKFAKSQRRKRGLINIVGSVQKFIFGTLDASDGERYDNALKILKDNQIKIIKEVNSQISLSKSLNAKYSKTIDEIIINQRKITNHIASYSERLTNVTNDFHKYTMYLSIINQIFISANVIITFLDNLENAITFARLHVTHPDILTHKNLKEILYELPKYYKTNGILNISLFSWYSVIQTNCYFSENNIIFAVEIPIAYPETLRYFHLFPIPTKDNHIIIPRQPYLALTDKVYQYMEQPCMKLENIYICRQEITESDPKFDCVTALIQDLNPVCHPVPIKSPKLLLN